MGREARRRRGQALTEYVLLVALVAVATIGVATLFGDNVRRLFGAAASALAGEAQVEVGAKRSRDALHTKTLRTFAQDNQY